MNENEVAATQREKSAVDPMHAFAFLDPEELMKIMSVRIARLRISQVMMHIRAKMTGRKVFKR